MRWLRTARSAGLVALAVTATVLAGAAPASADITVDSAVCLANTKADITVPKPVVHAPEHAEMAWVVLLSTYCTAANAKIFLVYLEMPYEVQVPPVADVDLFVGGRWKLSLRTSLGRKDLGTVTVQVI